MSSMTMYWSRLGTITGGGRCGSWDCARVSGVRNAMLNAARPTAIKGEGFVMEAIHYQRLCALVAGAAKNPSAAEGHGQ